MHQAADTATATERFPVESISWMLRGMYHGAEDTSPVEVH
jgi:hypothetical protein